MTAQWQPNGRGGYDLKVLGRVVACIEVRAIWEATAHYVAWVPYGYELIFTALAEAQRAIRKEALARLREEIRLVEEMEKESRHD